MTVALPSMLIMGVGYKFYRNTLTKVVLLGIAGVFFLFDYFKRNSLRDESTLVLVYIVSVALIWLGFATVLTVVLVRAKKKDPKK